MFQDDFDTTLAASTICPSPACAAPVTGRAELGDELVKPKPTTAGDGGIVRAQRHQAIGELVTSKHSNIGDAARCTLALGDVTAPCALVAGEAEAPARLGGRARTGGAGASVARET